MTLCRSTFIGAAPTSTTFRGGVGHHHARGVLQRLTPLPERRRARHAAGLIYEFQTRLPSDRHGGRERLDVRRRFRHAEAALMAVRANRK